MSSIFNSQNIERMRVNGNEIALAKINGNVVFQKKKLIKTFFGDSKQDTTSGKNLNHFLDENNDLLNNGFNYQKNGEKISISGTANKNWDYKLSDNITFKAGKNYTMSYVGDIDNLTLYLLLGSQNGGQKSINKNIKSVTFLINEDVSTSIKFSASTGFNTNVLNLGIQIEEGTVATEYEPYTGGKPSPSPDYPQKISSINGVNLKLIGKNLYNNEYTNNIVSNEGIITSNPNWNMSDYIEIEPNKSYTFSHNDENSTGQSLIIAEFDENKNFIKRNSQGNYNYETYEPYTIITNSNTKFIILNYNNTYNNSLFQLEKGSQVTTYEPYKNQIIPINLQNNILAKVGDYADELQVYSNGDVKLIKKIREYKMTGNENVSNMHTGNLFDYQLFFNNKPYIVGYGLSNYYKYNPVQSGINPATVHGEFVLQHWSDGIDNNYNLLIKDTNHDNITNFKNHLAELYNAETPVKIYYPLVNSTTTKVDNIKSELNSFGDYSNIEIETTYS